MAQKEVKTRRNQQVQEVIREQVVEYLKKELGTQKQAAEIFGLAERSINRIWARYNEGWEKRSG